MICFELSVVECLVLYDTVVLESRRRRQRDATRLTEGAKSDSGNLRAWLASNTRISIVK